MRPRQLPIAAVLCVLAAGLGLAAFVDWQPGTIVTGVAMLLAAGLRLTLPTRQVGLLAVRSRGVDAGVLLVLGFATVLLANAIPEA